MKREEKRGSDRIMLTLALKVQGTDEKGHGFEVEAWTCVLSRHGARIRLNRLLQRDQTIRIINIMSRRAADFRVVGAVAPFSAGDGEYGVEYLDRGENIWGIQFPPLGAEETVESNAVLECRNCQSVELWPLSLVEAEVLQTSGILSKLCAGCQTITPWSYSSHQINLGGAQRASSGNQEKTTVGSTRGRERRRYQRVSLHLPVRIRDYAGGVEVTQCENISKGGLCFTSEKKYGIGEGLMITCPYHSSSVNIEVRAHVASARKVEGSTRCIYGIRFARQGH